MNKDPMPASSTGSKQVVILLVFVGLVAFAALATNSTTSNVRPTSSTTNVKRGPMNDNEVSSFASSQLDKRMENEVVPTKVDYLSPATTTSFAALPPPPPLPISDKLHNAKSRHKATYQPSADRLSRYVNKEYVSAATNAAAGPEWSFDTLERQHLEMIKNATYPSGNAQTDKNLLFVDGREKCENAREFLIRVRRSGFQGKIIFLAFYPEDEADCQSLANDFQPMTIFYRRTQFFEPTLMQYQGVLNYVKAFPEEFEKEGDDALYQKTIVVKPEAVFWCDQKNPFDDIPSSKDIAETDVSKWPFSDRYSNKALITKESIFGIVGEQSDLKYAHVEEKSSPFTCVSPNGRWNGTEEDKLRKENNLIDAFVGTTNPFTLIKFARMISTVFDQKEYDDPRPSFIIFSNIDPVKQFLNERLVQIEPAARYGAAVCINYLPEDSSTCYSCDRFTLIAGTSRCMRKVTYDVPNYTPFCLLPYREPIMEVPYKMTMVMHAKDTTLKGAHTIRDQPKGIFSEEPDPMRTVSEQCPNGVLGVLTMMAGYDILKVKPFIASFLTHGNPNCTKMIMMVKPGMNMEKPAMVFPDRIEYVHLDDSSEYAPVKMKGCGAADFRFEVAQRWLEKNYKRFRYIMATDSRDYVFLADPLAQLASILKKQDYIDDEFVGSVAENFAVGASAHPTTSVTYFLQSWLHSCGNKCFRRLGHLEYTNGEPFAVLNSGHIIGTSLGLLHYYRFHVRMMNESNHKCDGTDQGLFTYYMYGMLQESHYPHKVLVFSSSRSGFANLPSPLRMSRRKRTDLAPGETPRKQIEQRLFDDSNLSDKDKARSPNVYEFEYTITDCNNNIIAGLHQFDRHYPDYHFLERSPGSWRPFAPWVLNHTFDAEFLVPPKP